MSKFKKWKVQRGSFLKMGPQSHILIRHEKRIHFLFDNPRKNKQKLQLIRTIIQIGRIKSPFPNRKELQSSAKSHHKSD